MKCASSQILKYEYTEESKDGSLNSIYGCGKGVCTEFSRVFNDLASTLNLEAKFTNSSHHAYNQVLLKGKWVYLEPQTSECLFFTEEPEYFESNIKKSNVDNKQRFDIPQNSKFTVPTHSKGMKGVGH